eukprot:CAMPEP_0174300218 /NCGR_PEP_ID=MMETSP0809-20121228/58339_1 /TAXON_ID=73025 ORGANISM="Eutreptiella gymnastica-like, Strain CCMP1594" /NCGR_SAMPLE_ID=MMETSP0809 /ASSEMBLY_ACC=CAM_ASM_000658 /LENGTH=719 /DNA_ID=CAMNT_0015405765 /DNA_START=78 /DNA_END=2237 /DNA_ORIENTATION=+
MNPQNDLPCSSNAKRLTVTACVSACVATLLIAGTGASAASREGSTLRLHVSTPLQAGWQTTTIKSPNVWRGFEATRGKPILRGTNGAKDSEAAASELNIPATATVLAPAFGLAAGSSLMSFIMDNQALLIVGSVLSFSLGIWSLLRGPQSKLQAQPALQPMAAYGTPAIQNIPLFNPMTVLAPGQDSTKTTPVRTPVTRPEVNGKSPQDGLWTRGLHAEQVPASPGVAGHYRTVALPAYNPQHTYAACVVGGGPAGLALAWQMAKAGLSVVVVDNAMANDWPNNYGVWAEEWHSMGLPEDTLAQTWEKTRIQYTTEEGDVLNRPYGRVDREKTKTFLLEECVSLGVQFCVGHVAQIEDGNWNERCQVKMAPTAEDVDQPSPSVLCQMPVVAAGHYSPLLKYQSPGSDNTHSNGEWMTKDWSPLLSKAAHKGEAEKAGAGGQTVPGSPWGWHYGAGGSPAYQVAYGEEIETEGPHGFPVNEMLLMDWTDDHLGDNKKAYDKTPTFLYAMPTDETHIFVEDTSLVARPTVTMEDLKARLEMRMKQKGIKIKKVNDVEKSVIPLGGPLPLIGHRTIGYGASNNLVHPATGYMVNRAIAEAPELAEAIARALRDGQSIEDATAAAWNVLWPSGKLRTRDFHVFAMEMLADMDTELIREFFGTFFKDKKDTTWQEYLAWSMDETEMMSFAMGVYFRASPRMKLRLMTETFKKEGFSVIRSLLKL